MTITCNNCVINENFPETTFTSSGVCNYCLNFKDSKEIKMNKYESQFEELISIIRKNKSSPYDCMLCYSGGKDSTYTLYLLKKKYKLNILTYTFDNGFLSSTAKHNIKTVTDNLAVDNITFSPDFSILKNIFKDCIFAKDKFSHTALKRASEICNSCINFVKYNSLKTASEKKIPLIVFGWSPSQISEKSIIVKLPAAFLIKSQNIFTNMFKEIFSDKLDNYFLTDQEYKNLSINMPYYINPLLFNSYDLNNINTTLTQIGWEKPKNTDANSTNCLLNTLANTVHLKKYGYNPYTEELSTLVRKGLLKRDIAICKLDEPINNKILNECFNKLDLKEAILEEI